MLKTNFLFLCLILTPFSPANANVNVKLQEADRSWLSCSIQFNNTGDIDKFESCSGTVFNNLDISIKESRELSKYAQKATWDKTNQALQNHLLLCKNNAQKTQKNSTIKKDLLSCQFFYLRSLAYEANKLI